MFTILDVVLEVNPDSHDLLQKLVLDLVQKESPDFPNLQKIPHLHFMSMQIFEDPHYDPLFIFENNFDGNSEAYWTEVLKVLESDLRQMFACSKAALGPNWAGLFKAGSKDSLIPFIKEFSVPPSASHIGAVGIPLARIKRDSAFFDDLQIELGVTKPVYAGGSVTDLHKNLREWAIDKFSWFSEPEPAPIGKEQRTYRFAKLKTLMPKAAITLLIFVFLLCAAVLIPRLSQIIVVAILTLLATGTVLAWRSIVTLRSLESTDYNQSKPALDPDQLADFARFEDQIVQNHLASMVLVKPGTLRSMIIHAALYALRLYVPFANYDGYLGAMRTIHFAHWTLIGNEGRLLFLSNFDGSWQSYLDDFVDKAAAGLTLAWGNCVGFPETKWLVKDGAAHGTQFKAWARQSQTSSPMWYSAYRTLTVNQIIRNAEIVDGLRKTALAGEEANKWATLL